VSWLSKAKEVVEKGAAIAQYVEGTDPTTIVTEVNRSGTKTNDSMWFGDDGLTAFGVPFVHNIQDQWDVFAGFGSGSDLVKSMDIMLDPALDSAGIGGAGDGFDGAYLNASSSGFSSISGTYKETRDDTNGDPQDIGLIKSLTGNGQKIVIIRYKYSGGFWNRVFGTDIALASLQYTESATYFAEGLSTKAQYLSANVPAVTVAKTRLYALGEWQRARRAWI